MEELTLESLISSDPITKGFDLTSGTKWIYPLNYPFRDYQHTITETALFHNTLVCLPTGLGKTFIAAVVMYNFWRWYPQGKIVFLAPTKPLVAQQIDACYNIMGIPPSETIELTGSMNPKNRRISWFKKRVIFATPQVLQNDLDKNIAPGELIKCVVIDEAHKALGKHSYCESIRLLRTQNNYFRVLALSATPGSTIEQVQQVIQNLCISRLELRDETSRDITPYLNKRQMDIILVPLSDNLVKFKEKFVAIMNFHLRRLIQFKILTGDISNISKGRIFYLTQEFKSKTNRPANYGQIMQTLNRCMSLTHAYELLVRHGLRAFCAFCQNHSSDSWVNNDCQLRDLLREIEAYLGPFPDIEPLLDGSIQEVSEDVVFGHSKFYKLKLMLLQHFKKYEAQQQGTRAIVFVEYRESVNEVYVCLLQSSPIIRPQMFVGQSGQKRKQQFEAMEAFRTNKANVLISTSVGEEGLDVGEVDLIVCFDMSQRSPIRLVQRMGRTGRRRDGRIIMLVTDGKEHQTLKSTIYKKDSMNNKVLHSSHVVSALYHDSPRMVPSTLMPECRKMHIEVQAKVPKLRGNKKKDAAIDEVKDKKNSKKSGGKYDKEAAECDGEKVKSTQSTMLKFLRKPSSDEISQNISSLPSQTGSITQVAHPESVKLLTSDEAAVEFLTLCAIRTSKLEDARSEFNRMDTSYLPKHTLDLCDHFADYPVPDANILNCIALLEECAQSTSPATTQDHYYEEIDHVSLNHEPEQHDLFDDFAIDDLPLMGKSHFEDLLNDSSDSDKTMFMEAEEDTKPANDLQNISADKRENVVCPNSNVHDPKIGNIPNTNDQRDIASLENDNFSDPGTFENCIGDTTLDFNDQAEPVVKGFFESILSDSSDDEVVIIDEQIDVQKSTNASSKHIAMNDSSDHQKYQQTLLTSVPNVRKVENVVKAPNITPLRKTIMPKEVPASRQSNFQRSPSKLAANKKAATNNTVISSFFKPNNNKRSYARTEFEPKTTVFSNEKDAAKRFKGSWDEDNDVIVIEDDDDVAFDERMSVKQSMSDSSACTITQMIDLIGKKNSRRLNTSPTGTIEKSTTYPSALSKSSVVGTPKTKSDKFIDPLRPAKMSTDQRRNNTRLTSRFFAENSSVNSKATDIDSDWENDFEIDGIPGKTCDGTGSRVKTVGTVEKTLSEIFSHTVFEPLEKYESEPRNDANNKSPLAQDERTSSQLIDDFNLENYEWDSDFETPDNPVESLKRFAHSNATPKSCTKTDMKADHAVQYPKLLQFKNSKVQPKMISPNQASKFASPKEKSSSIRKKEIARPSTSKANFFEGNDFEDDWFETDKREKGNKPTANCALVSIKSPIKFNRFKLSISNKENAQPKTGTIDLSQFSAGSKFSNQMKLESTAAKGALVENQITCEYRRSLEKKRKKNDKKLRNRAAAEFLDYEAEVTCASSSGSSGDDDDVDGLVTYTQDIPESVDMQAHYLQSIKDVHRAGAFHFKNVRTIVPDDEVFSQSMSRMESSMYEYDSFCVSEGDEQDENDDEDSRSELGEITLDRNKKRQRAKSKEKHSSKKRKLLNRKSDSSSSEDETEKLRKQIIDESMIMKKRKY